jgi:hypothetical protein
MNPTDIPGLTPTEKLLIFAVSGLTLAVVSLFWQLLKSNAREVDAYKLCAPLVQKLTDLCEKLMLKVKSGKDD